MSLDFSVTRPPIQYWFIHEMVHVWQYQPGMNVKTRGVMNWAVSYRYSLPNYKFFSSYSMEQQASIIADYFYPLNVSIKDNMPCFSVPTKIFERGRMKSRGINVSTTTGFYNNRFLQQQVSTTTGGKLIDHWSSPIELTDIYPNQCVTYPEFNWQTGEYSVLMGIVSKKDNEPYRLRKTFILDIQSNGDRVIREIN